MKNAVIDEKKNKKDSFYLLNDNIVKKLFTNGSKASEEFLYEIISTVLKVPKKQLKRDFRLMHPEIAVNDKMINSEADLVYENDKIYISLEFNYNNYKELLSKNISYVCCLYLKDLQHKENYKNLKEIYSINIDGFDYFKKNQFIYESEMFEKNLLLPRNLNIHYVDINLEYLKKIGYNNIASELEKWCYIFVCDNDQVFNEIYEEGSYMREFRKEAEKLSSELDTMLYYDKKKLDQEIVYNNGKEDGKKEVKKEIAKKMLDANESIDKIMNFTKLSKNEILELK